jgi:hypothetical protein
MEKQVPKSLIKKFADWPEAYRVGADPGDMTNDRFIITDTLPVPPLNRPLKQCRAPSDQLWEEVWLITRTIEPQELHVWKVPRMETLGRMLDEWICDSTVKVRTKFKAIMIAEMYHSTDQAVVAKITIYRLRSEVIDVLEGWHQMHRTK